MTDVTLFKIRDQKVVALPKRTATVEKSLQSLIETNLETLLGVRFLATEYSTGPKHRGRIDTLGIDENGCPVIIEYKRASNENVINQGLFYLDWLMDHQGEFKLLVIEKCPELANQIDWSSPRLLCIAGDFTRYDQHAVEQINRNIELIRYAFFGNDLLLLELVNAVTALPATSNSTSNLKTMAQILEGLSGPLQDLYEELRTFLLSLGDDVQEKILKHYVAFKRLKNFACVEIHPNKGILTVYVKVDPDQVSLEKGFTRDVRDIGHYGTGGLEITLHSHEDLERAKSLLERSYEVS